jgi:hypothetical protein
MQDQSKEHALKFLLMDFLFITRLMRLVLCSLLARDVMLMIIGLSFCDQLAGACSAFPAGQEHDTHYMTSHLFSRQLMKLMLYALLVRDLGCLFIVQLMF